MRLDHLLSKESTPGPEAFVLGLPEHSHVDHWLIGDHGRALDPTLSFGNVRGTTEPRGTRTSLFRFEGVAARLSRRASVSLATAAPPLRSGALPEASGPERCACAYLPPSFGAPAPPHPPLENCIASTSIKYSQATKSQRWMPWRQMPMKDVGGCEKPRGAAYQALIRGYPNGETRLGSCPVTPA